MWCIGYIVVSLERRLASDQQRDGYNILCVARHLSHVQREVCDVLNVWVMFLMYECKMIMEQSLSLSLSHVKSRTTRTQTLATTRTRFWDMLHLRWLRLLRYETSFGWNNHNGPCLWSRFMHFFLYLNLYLKIVFRTIIVNERKKDWVLHSWQHFSLWWV